jgi:DNA-directed RNA polymerase specialized sigma24 family protein
LSFARSRLIGSAARPGYLEVEDLFADAVVRTMMRKRHWTRGVGVFHHFFAVMRSICHQRLKQSNRFTALSESAATPQNQSLSALDARSIVARLKEQLRSDAVALNILGTMTDEADPRCAQKTLGINAGVYWAARKRIRRAAEGLTRGPALQRRGSATGRQG